MILSRNIPQLDLHGLDREYAAILIKEFVNDHYKMKDDAVQIIHGRGQGILRKTTHEVLKKNKLVKTFYIDFFNVGCTIVELNKNI